MPTFSEQDLMNMETQGSMETKFTPPDQGDYTAVVKEVKVRQGIAKSSGEPFHALDVMWELQNVEDMMKRLEMDRPPVVKQGLFLDIDEQTGKLAVGKNKNVHLGRLRESLGLNQPDKPFSFRMLEGRAARVRVKHTVDTARNETYANVDGVAALPPR